MLTVTRQAVTHIRESGWFKSIYTLQGNLIHMTHTLPASVHVRHSSLPTSSPRMWQSFVKLSIELNGSTAPKKMALILIHNTPADQSVGPYLVSLPQQPLKLWGKVKHLLVTSYINLLNLYLQHMISTFNTYSQGPTHQSLTNTDGGDNLRGVGFPHHTLCPSQPTVIRFSPMAPPNIRLTSST
jgi:hypothetical protein